MKNEMIRRATLSDCKKYRYSLLRKWDEGATLLFIMLNPSTADAEKDDPTVRKCITLAKKYGFGSLYIGNLYGFRATNPRDVLKLGLRDAEGPRNESMLRAMIQKSSKIIVAWGNHGVQGTHRVKELLSGI